MFGLFTCNLCRRFYSCGDALECLKGLPTLIHNELVSDSEDLEQCSRYLIDGRGKGVRPTMVLLMGAACNYTTSNKRIVTASQQTVAMVTEMIHTASLVHDDIIDGADTRRGKPSVNKVWGERKAMQAGNFILARASHALAGLNNPYIVDLLTNVIEDLVQGEVMQLDSVNGGSGEEERLLEQYLEKTFRKTASLMAYSCQAVAVLSQSSEELCQSAYDYGRSVGLAFQIVDDILDFKCTQSCVGKPTAVDLRLGLATAPVLYAARKHPEVYKSIESRFSGPSEIERTIELVLTSGAIESSYQLAGEYCDRAIHHLELVKECREKEQLMQLARDVVERRT